MLLVGLLNPTFITVPSILLHRCSTRLKKRPAAGFFSLKSTDDCETSSYIQHERSVISA
jgi:hypothetical protein